MRIGYAPYDDTLMRPGDRRRFPAYARARNLQFELADPRERYDLVILSELADISVWENYPHGQIVFDLIDAYLSIPRTDVRQLLRGSFFYLTGRHQRLHFDYLSNLRRMCQRSAAVVCSTGEQAELIGRYCNNVRIILDSHDTVATAVKTDYRLHDPVRLVWEGLASNLPQLATILPVLRDYELHVVTEPGMAFHHAIMHEWDERTAAKIITDCDIAIIPIDLNDRFVSAKPENKLLLLWRMGMPVIASATPAYKRCLGAIGAGDAACTTAEDWRDQIQFLTHSYEFRAADAIRGRKYAAQFDSKHMMGRWDDLFRSLGFNFHEVANATVAV